MAARALQDLIVLVLRAVPVIDKVRGLLETAIGLDHEAANTDVFTTWES
jgi:hypothetical protein